MSLGADRGIQRSIVAFFIAILVLPAVSLWGSYQTQKLTARIVAVGESRLLLSRALRYVADEDAAMRDYLQTGEQLFVQRQRRTRGEIDALLRILPRRFRQAGFEVALPDLDDFARRHNVWLATVVDPMLSKPRAVNRSAIDPAGKSLLDAMSADVIRIHTKGVLLAERDAQRTAGVIRASVIISALWIFGVFVFTLILQRRAVRNQNELVDSIVGQREELSRLSEWRARLLTMLAHDFKSQLAVLTGGAHLLEDFPQRRGDAELLRSLRQAAYALADMADNAILLARAQERTIALAPAVFDIGESVETVLGRYRSEREFHLHRAAPAAMVAADRACVARVLDNIIGNAVKYSDEPIHVYLHETGEFVRVDVVDRGIGITGEELPRIFEAFWRSPRVSPGKSGNGVGLFIVKTIVEAHGGTIEVQSERGRGTTVSVCFTRALHASPVSHPPIPA